MNAVSFATASIKEVVDDLTNEETISLIAGVGMWETAAVSRPAALSSAQRLCLVMSYTLEFHLFIIFAFLYFSPIITRADLSLLRSLDLESLLSK